MKSGIGEIENLLVRYLSGELSEKDRIIVNVWRKKSFENEILFNEFLHAWEAIPLLNRMEQFNSFNALKKISKKVYRSSRPKLWIKLQRIAAIMLLPIILYSGYLTLRIYSINKPTEDVIMQTVSSRQNMVTFSLPDSTKVWLNSNSNLQFPNHFNKDKRIVKLIGEAYFEVTKNDRKTFSIITQGHQIDALGTSFNVTSYDNTPTEVVLVEGQLRLSSTEGWINRDNVILQPGHKAIFNNMSQNIDIKEVDVNKFIAWINGDLIFYDDSMEDVVKRLSSWYNIEISIKDPEIKNYVYTAKFHNENIDQVLALLKISAPIDYQIIESELKPGSEFTKRKIYLMVRK